MNYLCAVHELFMCNSLIIYVLFMNCLCAVHELFMCSSCIIYVQFMNYSCTVHKGESGKPNPDMRDDWDCQSGPKSDLGFPVQYSPTVSQIYPNSPPVNYALFMN